MNSNKHSSDDISKKLEEVAAGLIEVASMIEAEYYLTSKVIHLINTATMANHWAQHIKVEGFPNAPE